MHRKVQVFSIPSKVSIGQDRNKKDPQRGRKLPSAFVYASALFQIEIKKIPKGDGNYLLAYTQPHQESLIEIKKIPKGDGNFSTPAALAYST